MQTLANSKSPGPYSWILKMLLVVSVLILLVRAVELQLIKGGYFRSLSENNRIRRITISAPRGRILAKGGEALAENKEVRKKIVFDAKEGYIKTTGVSEKDREAILEYERYYPNPKEFAHITGYVGKPGPSEVGKIRPGCKEKGIINPESVLGIMGIEKEYNCVLSGIDGEELIEVDSSGRKIRILGIKKPVSGEDLKLAIDFGLQKNIASAIEEKTGAVVATDKEGRVLALYSFPTFDPNIFVSTEDGFKIREVLQGRDFPLFNRAISGLYHPGSVFKPVVGLAALGEGKIDSDFKYEDPGVIKIGDFSYSNWYFSQYGNKEGEINLEKAISRSTDTFFYKIGEMAGIDNINKWAGKLGLTEKTGIDLGGESSGFIPTPQWKEKTRGERWFLGNTYHVSIGQGDVVSTPIGMNNAISSLLRGALCTPKLTGEPLCNDLEAKAEHLSVIRRGMKEACSKGGTGYTFFDFPSPVLCKTGTAETNEDGKTHAWFVLGYPSDDPAFFLTVLIEKGGEGSKIAGPVARKIMDYWVKKINNN